MGNINKEMGIPRRNPKEILEIKSYITEMKNDLYGFIDRLDMAKAVIRELKARSVETCQIEMHRGKKKKE